VENSWLNVSSQWRWFQYVTWNASGITLGFSASSARRLSAGGQDEQLWEVKSSTTIGCLISSVFKDAKRAFRLLAQNNADRAKMAMAIEFLIITLLFVLISEYVT